MTTRQAVVYRGHKTTCDQCQRSFEEGDSIAEDDLSGKVFCWDSGTARCAVRYTQQSGKKVELGEKHFGERKARSTSGGTTASPVDQTEEKTKPRYSWFAYLDKEDDEKAKAVCLELGVFATGSELEATIAVLFDLADDYLASVEEQESSTIKRPYPSEEYAKHLLKFADLCSESVAGQDVVWACGVIE